MNSFFPFGAFFNIFPVIFVIVTVLIIGVFVYILVRSIAVGTKNKNSPLLTVPAVVVAKRTRVGSHAGDVNSMNHTYTRYYATFEFESGDRLELAVSGDEYGVLAENDIGKLSFRGTKFEGFERRM